MRFQVLLPAVPLVVGLQIYSLIFFPSKLSVLVKTATSCANPLLDPGRFICSLACSRYHGSSPKIRHAQAQNSSTMATCSTRYAVCQDALERTATISKEAPH